MAEAPTTTSTSLSPALYIPVLVLGNLSSLLSILGSGSVLYMAYPDVSHRIQHRLLFGVSVADLVMSTSSLLMPYLIPRRVVDLPGASGTAATCTATGFFLVTFMSIGCCYSGCLSVYYLLVIRRGWKENDFQPKWEILLHLVAAAVPLSISAAAIATQSFNPVPAMNNLCAFAALPWGCGSIPDLECTRSKESIASKLYLATFIWEGTWSITSFVGAFLVWRKVRKTIQRSSMHRFDGDLDSSSAEKLRQVGIQAVLYSAAYFNTFLWPFIALLIVELTDSTENIDRRKGEPSLYLLLLLFWTLFPLQGFLNFFIFTRIRVQQWQKADPKLSLLAIYCKILASEDPPRCRSLSRCVSAERNLDSKHTVPKFPSGDQLAAFRATNGEEDEEDEEDDGLIE